MEFSDVIKIRHSCRSFLNKQIEPEIMDEILDAGRIAPSAQNRQPWRYMVVQDSVLIKKIAFHSIIGTANFFIKNAPIVIIAYSDPKSSLRLNNQNYYLVDVAISFHQMMLAAWNRGVGSCWLAAFDEPTIKSLLEIPDNFRIVGLSPFGYPKDKNIYARLVSFVAGSSKRKEKKELIILK